MKIRTDFVTNSSSSSFVLELQVIDKDDHVYTLRDYSGKNRDQGVCAYFKDGLESVLQSYLQEKTEALIGIFELEKLNEFSGNELAETLKKGEEVTFAIKKIKGYESYYYERILVSCRKGALGYAGEGTQGLLELLHSPELTVKGYVDEVIPLSQRSSRARKAIIKIKPRIIFEKKNPAHALRYDSVDQLCAFLIDSVRNDNDDDDYDMQDRGIVRKMKAEKKKFKEALLEGVTSISELKKIVLKREYSAWGEFADLIVENDWELRELAEKVVSSEGKEREKIREHMMEYIKSSNGTRAQKFGKGFEDFRYVWGKDFDIDSLAYRLCSGRVEESSRGREYTEIDVATGKVNKFAEFVIDPMYIEDMDLQSDNDIQSSHAKRENSRGESYKKYEIELGFEFTNGEKQVFYDCSSGRSPYAMKYFQGKVKLKISPQQLGMSKSIEELEQKLIDAIVDFDGKNERKIFEQADLRPNLSMIESMDEILNISISYRAWNKNESLDNYLAEYTYFMGEEPYYCGDILGIENADRVEKVLLEFTDLNTCVMDDMFVNREEVYNEAKEPVKNITEKPTKTTKSEEQVSKKQTKESRLTNEENKQQQEEEKKRKEEEKKRKEEEKKHKEEEKKRKEEEKQRKLEEKKRKEEEQQREREERIQQVRAAQEASLRISNLLCVSDGAAAVVTIDGKVLTVGLPVATQKEVESWTDIQQICMWNKSYPKQASVVGLKYDGTLNVADEYGANSVYKAELAKWSDIEQIACYEQSFYGVDKNGAVHCAGVNVIGKNVTRSWNSVKKILRNSSHVIGITHKNEIYAQGGSKVYSPSFTEEHIVDVTVKGEEWIYALTDTGEVLAPVSSSDETKWKEVVSISSYGWNLAGVTLEGKIKIDKNSSQIQKYEKAKRWKDIICAKISPDIVLAVTTTGHVKVSGKEEFSNLDGKRLFNNYLELKEERAQYEKRCRELKEQRAREEKLRRQREEEARRKAEEDRRRKEEEARRQVEERERKRVQEINDKINALEMEKLNVKGLFAGMKRKKLQKQIDDLKGTI